MFQAARRCQQLIIVAQRLLLDIIDPAILEARKQPDSAADQHKQQRLKQSVNSLTMRQRRDTHISQHTK